MQRVGLDESGKGDYFGPLVVAAVCANEEIEERLKAMDVKDSKRLSDKRILELDDTPLSSSETPNRPSCC